MGPCPQALSPSSGGPPHSLPSAPVVVTGSLAVLRPKAGDLNRGWYNMFVYQNTPLPAIRTEALHHAIQKTRTPLKYATRMAGFAVSLPICEGQYQQLIGAVASKNTRKPRKRDVLPEDANSLSLSLSVSLSLSLSCHTWDELASSPRSVECGLVEISDSFSF